MSNVFFMGTKKEHEIYAPIKCAYLANYYYS